MNICSPQATSANPVRDAFYEEFYKQNDENWKYQRINDMETKLNTFINFVTDRLNALENPLELKMKYVGI